MALIDKLKTLADSIRAKTDTTDELTLDQMAEKVGEIESDPPVIVLVDESGNEVVGFLTDEKVDITATVNDIRKDVIAVTDSGIAVGEKEIPAYHTMEGMRVITAGKEFSLEKMGEDCEFTKLQALLCSNSLSTEKVCIDKKVYAVNSTTAISDVIVDAETQAIKFGITNETSSPYVIRFFTYREEY